MQREYCKEITIIADIYLVKINERSLVDSHANNVTIL